MNPISDGKYALFTTDDGKATKVGEFQVINGAIQYVDPQSESMIGDMFPTGKIDGSTNERCHKMLGHEHGYMHLEQIK